MTQKYIIKRQKLKELAATKKKEIDRKATKGRKIRYVVHDKLLSFMTPDDNHN
jgi:protein AATF/BFR2